MTQTEDENPETWIALAALTRDVVAWLGIRRPSDEESRKEAASEISKAPDAVIAIRPALDESAVRSK